MTEHIFHGSALSIFYFVWQSLGCSHLKADWLPTLVHSGLLWGEKPGPHVIRFVYKSSPQKSLTFANCMKLCWFDGVTAPSGIYVELDLESQIDDLSQFPSISMFIDWQLWCTGKSPEVKWQDLQVQVGLKVQAIKFYIKLWTKRSIFGSKMVDTWRLWRWFPDSERSAAAFPLSCTTCGNARPLCYMGGWVIDLPTWHFGNLGVADSCCITYYNLEDESESSVSLFVLFLQTLVAVFLHVVFDQLGEAFDWMVFFFWIKQPNWYKMIKHPISSRWLTLGTVLGYVWTVFLGPAMCLHAAPSVPGPRKTGVFPRFRAEMSQVKTLYFCTVYFCVGHG